MLMDLFVWYHLYISLGFSTCYTRNTMPWYKLNILSRPSLKMSSDNKIKWYLKFSDHSRYNEFLWFMHFVFALLTLSVLLIWLLSTERMVRQFLKLYGDSSLSNRVKKSHRLHNSRFAKKFDCNDSLIWMKLIPICHFHGRIKALTGLKIGENIWASSREKLSSGVCGQVRLKPACSATETY